MTTRRTKADRDAEYSLSETRVWNDFVAKLAALQTFEDAKKLGFFLQQFTVPDGSGTTERSLNLAFIQRLDDAGELKPGARQQIEAAFKAAGTARRP